MVTKRVVRMAVAIMISIAVVSVGVSTLLPSMSDHPGEHCASLLIKSSMAAYRNEFGRLPEDFRTYQELLKAIAGPSATIKKHSRIGYEIDVCCAGSQYRVHLDYHVAVNNKMENYNVIDIDCLDVCIESAGRVD